MKRFEQKVSSPPATTLTWPKNPGLYPPTLSPSCWLCHTMFGVKTNSLSVITSWVNSFNNLSFTMFCPATPQTFWQLWPPLSLNYCILARARQPGFSQEFEKIPPWEWRGTKESWWVRNWMLMMRDVARRDDFSCSAFSHALSTCAGSFQAGFGQAKWERHQCRSLQQQLR